MILCALRAFFVGFVVKYNIAPIYATWYYILNQQDHHKGLTFIDEYEVFIKRLSGLKL